MANLMTVAVTHFRRGHEAEGMIVAASFLEEALAKPLLTGAAVAMSNAIKRGDFLCAADTIEYGMLPFISLYE
jgi:hypothetical protein